MNHLKPSVYILDNYDSFTYNLVHYVESFAQKVWVERNDQVNTSNILKCDKILLSPGPGLPKNSGKMMDLIDQFHQKKPILGVCLGMQAIGEYFGATLENLPRVKHGVSSTMRVVSSENYLYRDLPPFIEVGRYHSWVVSANNFPEKLKVTGIDPDEYVLSFMHSTLDIQAVQYHPESILTPLGKKIIQNWVEHVY